MQGKEAARVLIGKCHGRVRLEAEGAESAVFVEEVANGGLEVLAAGGAQVDVGISELRFDSLLQAERVRLTLFGDYPKFNIAAKGEAGWLHFVGDAAPTLRLEAKHREILVVDDSFAGRVARRKSRPAF